MSTSFALVFAVAIAAPLPGQVTPASPHFDLEQMYSNGDFEALNAAIDARIAANPQDPDLYWMKARALYELGELLAPSVPASARIAHYTAMQTAAEKGLELRPGDAHLRFGRGIAMARLGTTRGVLSSLFMAKSIEADWLAAAATPTPYASLNAEEVLPADAYQALGIYYRLLPDWWIVQVLAGTRGNLDTSLKYHELAVSGRPTIDNIKELGATQLCIGTQRGDAAMLAAAQQTFDRALAIPATDAKGAIDHRHIRMLKADPSLGCGYSRDGQQDLDRSKLDAAAGD